MYLQCNGTLHFLNETKFIWKKYCQFGQILDRYGVFCLEPFKIAFRHYMYCIQLPLLCHKVWYVCLFSLTCAWHLALFHSFYECGYLYLLKICKVQFNVKSIHGYVDILFFRLGNKSFQNLVTASAKRYICK